MRLTPSDLPPVGPGRLYLAQAIRDANHAGAFPVMNPFCRFRFAMAVRRLSRIRTSK